MGWGREAGGQSAASDTISTTDPEPIPAVMSEDTSWHYPSAEPREHAPTIWAERSGTPLLLELKSNSNDSGHVRVVPYRPCSILSSISPIISHLDPLSSDTSLSLYRAVPALHSCRLYHHGRETVVTYRSCHPIPLYLSLFLTLSAGSSLLQTLTVRNKIITDNIFSILFSTREPVLCVVQRTLHSKSCMSRMLENFVKLESWTFFIMELFGK